MDFNGFKIVKLKKPVRGNLLYCDKMVRHLELSHLKLLVVRGEIPGEIPVLISGFCNTPRGKILQFSPIIMPGIKRYALRKFFNIDNRYF